MHVLESPRKQRRKVRPWEWVLLVPALIIWAFFWLTPILGLGAISDVRYASIEPDPEQAIPLAGVFYACALLYLIVSVVHWLATGRGWSGFYAIQATLALVLGAMTGGLVASKATSDSVANWQLWNIPIVATVVLAAIFAVLLFFAHLSKGVRSEPKAKTNTRPANAGQLLKQLRAQVAQLSPDQAADVRRTLHASMNDLEKRGLITAADAQRARSLELGALELRMSRFSE